MSELRHNDIALLKPTNKPLDVKVLPRIDDLASLRFCFGQVLVLVVG